MRTTSTVGRVSLLATICATACGAQPLVVGGALNSTTLGVPSSSSLPPTSLTPSSTTTTTSSTSTTSRVPSSGPPPPGSSAPPTTSDTPTTSTIPTTSTVPIASEDPTPSTTSSTTTSTTSEAPTDSSAPPPVGSSSPPTDSSAPPTDGTTTSADPTTTTTSSSTTSSTTSSTGPTTSGPPTGSETPVASPTFTTVTNDGTTIVVITGGGMTSGVPITTITEPPVTTPFPTTGTEPVETASSLSGVLVGLLPAVSSWSDNPAPSVASMVKSQADDVTKELSNVLEQTGNTPSGCTTKRSYHFRRSLLDDFVSAVSQALCDVTSLVNKVGETTEDMTESEIETLTSEVEEVTSEIENIAKTLPETIESDENDDDDNESSTTTSSSTCSASTTYDEQITCYSTTMDDMMTTVSTTTCETVTSTISGCDLEPTTTSTFVSSSVASCYVVSVSPTLYAHDDTTTWTGEGYETICDWPSTANDQGDAPYTWVAQDTAAAVDGAWQDAVGYATAKLWTAGSFATSSSTPSPGSSVTSMPSSTSAPPSSTTSTTPTSSAPSSSTPTMSPTPTTFSTMTSSTSTCTYTEPDFDTPYCENVVVSDVDYCTCVDDGKKYQPYTADTCQPVCPLASTYLDGYTEIPQATTTTTTSEPEPEPTPTLIAQNFKQCYSGSEYTFDQSTAGDAISSVCKDTYFSGNFYEVWEAGDVDLYLDGSGTDDAKFTINISENDMACPEGSSLLKEYTNNLNEDVCLDHLNTVMNGCAPFEANGDGLLLKGGGILYANCLSWEIRVDEL